MKKIVLSLVVSLFAVTSFSMPKYYFGIGDGKTHPMNQDNFTDTASSGNSHSYFGGYNLSEKWGFELAHNVFDFDSFAETTKTIHGNAVYHVYSSNRVHPFFKAGFGILEHDFSDSAIGKKTSLGLSVGTGLNFEILSQVSFILGLDYHLFEKFTNEIKTPQFLVPYVALTIGFGNVDSSVSHSMTTTSSGTQTAVKASEEKSADSVPVKVAVEPRDSDHDGIIDSEDKCVHTPSGLTVNKYGCAANEIGTATLNVLFEKGSSKITKETYSEVEKFANFMKNNPETNVIIKGHTDNTGSAEINNRISANRANAVVVELIKNGVEKKRLQGKGAGSTEPVADNSTEEGRKANRRVAAEITESKNSKK